jgi:hypothetical protein
MATLSDLFSWPDRYFNTTVTVDGIFVNRMEVCWLVPQDTEYDEAETCSYRLLLTHPHLLERVRENVFRYYGGRFSYYNNSRITGNFVSCPHPDFSYSLDKITSLQLDTELSDYYVDISLS